MTDQPVRSIVSEMVREKILATTGEEIPYVTAVVTEVFDETDPEMIRIFCAIYVERASQKNPWSAALNSTTAKSLPAARRASVTACV